jgi:hypothetical protein
MWTPTTLMAQRSRRCLETKVGFGKGGKPIICRVCRSQFPSSSGAIIRSSKARVGFAVNLVRLIHVEIVLGKNIVEEMGI